jgi:DNA topoisomerase-1
MAKDRSLVIVESPTKAKTITKILGSEFQVMSSMGHVIDLPRTKIGIDVEHDFEPAYIVIKGKEKLTAQLKSAASKCSTVYLATDPDREGEAISLHLKDLIEGKYAKKTAKSKKADTAEVKSTKPKKEKVISFKRVVFHEITKKAINEAFEHPGELDLAKVDAQQARRVLDRVVGYYLSPFLWRKVCRGLSAGRVQSVALKFIVDREREIQAFIPETFHYVDIPLHKDGQGCVIRLQKRADEKIELRDLAEAERIASALKGCSLTLSEKKVSGLKRKPLPPFTTSLLQQEAFRTLGFSTSRTMMVAQQLYEGIDLADGPMGLITYMRTDSFNIAPEAKASARERIAQQFGKDYVTKIEYAFKKKGIAQEAHEAIRPANVALTPAQVAPMLSADQAALYELIWARFMASQMSEAVYERTKLTFMCGEYEFTASGNRLVFDGFLKVYPDKQNDNLLPAFAEGETFAITDVQVETKVTQPPPRFNDASLVKLMEEKGIGRPSTYAPTISTLLKRDYVTKEKNAFKPSELGCVVTDLLAKYFQTVIDENFTAQMEQALDDVEEHNRTWVSVLKDFFPAFKGQLDNAQVTAGKELISAGETCEVCGRDMVYRYSKHGRFVSCSGYPECKNAHSVNSGHQCPECKEGMLVERKNKKGQRFYGCSRFPACRFTASRLPTKKADDHATGSAEGTPQQSSDEGVDDSVE